MTDAEVKTIENTIAKIDQEIEKSKGDERGKRYLRVVWAEFGRRPKGGNKYVRFLCH